MTEEEERERVQAILTAHREFMAHTEVSDDAFAALIMASGAVVEAFQRVISSVQAAHAAQQGQLKRIMVANLAATELFYAKVPPGTTRGSRT